MLAATLGLGLASAGCGQVKLPGDPGDDIDAGNGAPDGGGPGPVDPRPAHSFDITATLTYMDEGFPFPPAFLPEQHTFVLRLEDAGSTTEAIAGVAGEAVTGSFSQRPDGERVLVGGLVLPTNDDVSMLCTFGEVTYDSMTLETFDDDGDGAPDRVQGTATGSVTAFTDFLEGTPFTAELTGALDATPPQLALVGPSSNRSVLGDFAVRASEPLRPGGSVIAVSSQGLRVPLDPVTEEGGSIVSFVAPDEILLPFGEIVSLEVEPALEDLAGNRGTLDALTFETIAAPQDFPFDGFESDGNVTLSGSAALVPGVGTATALAGTTSLLVEPGGNATLRIPLQGDAAGLKLQMFVQGLYKNRDDQSLDGEVVIASPGAQAHARELLRDNSVEHAATGDEEWPFAGDLTLIVVPLPPNATDELIVVLRMFSPGLCSAEPLASPSDAVLIDEIVLVDEVVVGP